MKELDSVYSNKVLEDGKIPKNCRGTIVHYYHKNHFEVEFFDESGNTIDVVGVDLEDLSTEKTTVGKTIWAGLCDVLLFVWEIIVGISKLIFGIIKVLVENFEYVYVWLYFGYGFYTYSSKAQVTNNYLFIGMFILLLFVDRKFKELKKDK